MILGDDGKKLSTRHGAVSVMQYRDEGYLPEALLNYLVRLGWAHGDQEIFSLDEMVSYFDIVDVNKAAAAFNTEKLRWVNHHYITHQPPEVIAEHLRWQLEQLDLDLTKGPALSAIVLALRERSHTLKEMAEKAVFCFKAPAQYDDEAFKKHVTPDIVAPLTHLIEQLSQITDWCAPAIHEILQQVVNTHHLKFPKLAQPVRIAITGSTNSPSIDATLALLTQQEAIARLEQLLKNI